MYEYPNPSRLPTSVDSVPAALLLPVVSFLKMAAVVRREVDECVGREAESVERAEHLPHAPVHLLHVVAVRTVRGPTAELGARMQNCVHLKQGRF